MDRLDLHHGLVARARQGHEDSHVSLSPDAGAGVAQIGNLNLKAFPETNA
jgi:hypothetical protein